MIYDFAIVGGGIIGLSTAMHILETKKSAKIAIFEKEDQFAKHQTSHNSGVIHAGIYYKPGSFKAKLCREGLFATKNFCDKHEIPFKTCGKLIVATNPLEEKRIDDLFKRAKANGLKLKKINAKALRKIEPYILGTKALLSTETGMVDYRKIAIKMAEIIKNNGAEIYLNTSIVHISEKSDFVELGNKHSIWKARKLIVCGGLQADRLAKMAGMKIDFKVIPFRGEYFKLPTSKNLILNHHIYPAPDPALPFLGVHLTKMIDGGITVGPNAVIGFSREGYAKLSINLKDIASYVTFPGFWKLLWQHRFHILSELKSSIVKYVYLKNCQKYYPNLTLDDLLPYQAGIRAQVVTKNGEIVHDFLWGKTARMLHVFNAPSPAATSAIPIGRMIADKI